MDQKMENSKVKTLMGKYELGKFLGQGTFAKVYQARNIQTGNCVAIKVIDKEKVYKVGMVDQIKREISVMRLIRHPNVVELYEVMATKGKIYIVIEYVKGGELFSKVAKGKLSEDVARKYFQQLISAIDYCHSKGVYHRDLKPENLLLDENENLKVTDFGLSAVSGCQRQDGLLHTSCGTPSYVAPEVIFRKGYDGAKADIWSCGVILFVLLAGYLPFQDSNLMEMYKKIGKAEFKFPSWFSPEVRRMLAKILRPKPDKRSSIAKIMDSTWFKKGGYGQSVITKQNMAKLDEPVVVPAESESVEKDPVMGEEELPKQQQVFAKRCYSMNAFDIIALSKGLDLSGLFQEKRHDKVERFSVLEDTASSVTSKLEDVARQLRMKVKKMDGGGWMKFEGMKKRGSKGIVSIEVEIFELTSAFQMVEMKMSSGDTMEYEKIMKEDIRPALKDAISWTWLGDEQQQSTVQVER